MADFSQIFGPAMNITEFVRKAICPIPKILIPSCTRTTQHCNGRKRRPGANLQFHWIKPWNVNTGLAEDQFRQIKRTLSRGWPVCGGFRWPKHEVWQNEILQMVPAFDVFDGHSVLLVGFKEDASLPGGGVFLIRNSGGGAHDGALPYEYVRAYMNDGAWIQPASEIKP